MSGSTNTAACITACCVRPFNGRELSYNSRCSVKAKPNAVEVLSPIAVETETQTFNIGHVFHPQTETEAGRMLQSLHLAVGRPLAVAVANGESGALILSGQAEAGKTYLLHGSSSSVSGGSAAANPGLAIRILNDVLLAVESRKKKENITDSAHCHVSISYLEIHREQIRDLLNPMGVEKPLKAKFHPKRGALVEQLCDIHVNSTVDAHRLISSGHTIRSVGRNNYESHCTRSHAVLTITVKNRINEVDTLSKLHLVDPAAFETSSEDNSLSCLHSCLGHLLAPTAAAASSVSIDDDPTIDVSPRDSQLTMILADVLSGSSSGRLGIIAAISPAHIATEETLGVLSLVSQCARIERRVCVVEDPHDRLVEELTDEIGTVKEKLKKVEGGGGGVASDGGATTKTELLQSLVTLTEQFQTMTESADEKALKQKMFVQNHTRGLTRLQENGKVPTNNSLPRLHLLNDGIPAIVIPRVTYLFQGSNTLGRAANCTVPLDKLKIGGSEDVCGIHCILIVDMVKQEVWIRVPEDDAEDEDEIPEVFLNGRLLVDKTRLKHFDRIFFGPLAFRFGLPLDWTDEATKRGAFCRKSVNAQNLHNVERYDRLGLEVDRHTTIRETIGAAEADRLIPDIDRVKSERSRLEMKLKRMFPLNEHSDLGKQSFRNADRFDIRFARKEIEQPRASSDDDRDGKKKKKKKKKRGDADDDDEDLLNELLGGNNSAKKKKKKKKGKKIDMLDELLGVDSSDESDDSDDDDSDDDEDSLDDILSSLGPRAKKKKSKKSARDDEDDDVIVGGKKRSKKDLRKKGKHVDVLDSELVLSSDDEPAGRGKRKKKKAGDDLATTGKKKKTGGVELDIDLDDLDLTVKSKKKKKKKKTGGVDDDDEDEDVSEGSDSLDDLMGGLGRKKNKKNKKGDTDNANDDEKKRISNRKKDMASSGGATDSQEDEESLQKRKKKTATTDNQSSAAEDEEGGDDPKMPRIVSQNAQASHDARSLRSQVQRDMATQDEDLTGARAWKPDGPDIEPHRKIYDAILCGKGMQQTVSDLLAAEDAHLIRCQSEIYKLRYGRTAFHKSGFFPVYGIVKDKYLYYFKKDDPTASLLGTCYLYGASLFKESVGTRQFCIRLTPCVPRKLNKKTQRRTPENDLIVGFDDEPTMLKWWAILKIASEPEKTELLKQFFGNGMMCDAPMPSLHVSTATGSGMTTTTSSATGVSSIDNGNDAQRQGTRHTAGEGEVFELRESEAKGVKNFSNANTQLSGNDMSTATDPTPVKFSSTTSGWGDAGDDDASGITAVGSAGAHVATEASQQCEQNGEDEGRALEQECSSLFVTPKFNENGEAPMDETQRVLPLNEEELQNCIRLPNVYNNHFVKFYFRTSADGSEVGKRSKRTRMWLANHFTGTVEFVDLAQKKAQVYWAKQVITVERCPTDGCLLRLIFFHFGYRVFDEYFINSLERERFAETVNALRPTVRVFCPPLVLPPADKPYAYDTLTPIDGSPPTNNVHVNTIDPQSGKVAAVQDLSGQFRMRVSKNLTQKVSVWTGTLNLAGFPLQNDEKMLKWIPRECFDVYAITVQEASCRKTQRQFFNFIEVFFGSNYLTVSCVSMYDVLLIVVCRAHIYPLVTNVEASTCPSSIEALTGERGGIGISFLIGHTSMCFIACHLVSGQKMQDLRRFMMQELLQGLVLGTAHADVVSQFDYVFCLGDFGSTTANRPSTIEDLREAIYKRSLDEFAALNDSFSIDRKKKLILNGFSEGKIQFPPSYCYEVGTTMYNVAKVSAPQYRSRIFYKVRRHISQRGSSSSSETENKKKSKKNKKENKSSSHHEEDENDDDDEGLSLTLKKKKNRDRKKSVKITDTHGEVTDLSNGDRREGEGDDDDAEDIDGREYVNTIECLAYDSEPMLRVSEHAPVSAVFNIHCLRYASTCFIPRQRSPYHPPPRQSSTSASSSARNETTTTANISSGIVFKIESITVNRDLGYNGVALNISSPLTEPLTFGTGACCVSRGSLSGKYEWQMGATMRSFNTCPSFIEQFFLTFCVFDEESEEVPQPRSSANVSLRGTMKYSLREEAQRLTAPLEVCGRAAGELTIVFRWFLPSEV